MSLRLWLSGRRIVTQPASQVTHVQRRKRYALDNFAVRHNLLTLCLLHMDEPYLERIKKIWKNDLLFRKALSELTRLEAVEQYRKKFDALRIHNFEWFLNKFSIPFEAAVEQ